MYINYKQNIFKASFIKYDLPIMSSSEGRGTFVNATRLDIFVLQLYILIISEGEEKKKERKWSKF